MDLEHEYYLQVVLGSILSSYSWPTSCVATSSIVLTTQETLQILLADHLVSLPINYLNRDSEDVLKEDVPVLVLRRGVR